MKQEEYNYMIVAFVIGLVLGGLALTMTYKQNNKLQLTEACEQGCVWSQGYEYTDNFVNHTNSDETIQCIFKCNDVFYYGVKR